MTEPFAVCRAVDLPRPTDECRWLVRDLWRRAAVGIVGGAPKCSKSWFALDLAVSIASGTPCLGTFVVEQPGNALVFLAEDSLPDLYERLVALSSSRGLDLASLDLDVITEPVVRLDLPEHRERLTATLDRLRPRLLLLDPLVRLHRLDENSAQEISGLLGFLRELQRAFDCAIVLVHHASKKKRARPGQALRGSSDLHAFGDSNAYLAAEDDEFVLTLEHRAAPAPQPLRLRLVSRPDGSGTHLQIVGNVQPSAVPSPEPDLTEQIVAFLERADRPTLRRDIREALRVNNNRLGDVLVALETQGRIRREAGGWVVTRPVFDENGQPSLFSIPIAAGAGAPLVPLISPRCSSVGPSVGTRG
jgi:hypothetical protein